MAAQPKLDRQWNHLPHDYRHRRRHRHHRHRHHRRRHHRRCHQTMAQFEALPTPTVSQILTKIFFVNM